MGRGRHRRHSALGYGVLPEGAPLRQGREEEGGGHQCRQHQVRGAELAGVAAHLSARNERERRRGVRRGVKSRRWKVAMARGAGGRPVERTLRGRGFTEIEEVAAYGMLKGWSYLDLSLFVSIYSQQVCLKMEAVTNDCVNYCMFVFKILQLSSLTFVLKHYHKLLAVANRSFSTKLAPEL